ncbi:PD-(D/E)XK nuclease family protein [Halosegnis rubeus]|uniref:PD-(D/E)XK nuclease family protein n=1 Tax=Halosegnis rubeus TaxID=2212850 RepID=UPI0021F0F244|nr:PD-(D/E)XK nuclease family protein [Halosegnis rubeus]
MRRVLGIEAPDRLTREPDASDRGSYIHDVLEHYYLSLQSGGSDPVHPGGDFETRQQQLLDTALERLDTRITTMGSPSPYVTMKRSSIRTRMTMEH